MAAPLLVRNRNYRLLFSAGALTNLGDGLIALATPWLATLMTRDPLAIATVAAATRLPWLLFALPAGVVIDRADRRKLIARADALRACMVMAIMALALSEPAPQAVWALAGLTFLLGAAEVLRDNAAQTILPALVEPGDLEAANGQLWSAEQLAGQFLGPPLAGFLIASGVALPFGVDAALLAVAAGLVWMIALPPQTRGVGRFWSALREGVAWMRGDAPLLRLAVVLGLVNFLYMMAFTILVLFSQEALGLSAAQHGALLSAGALGAVTGSLAAPRVVARIGVRASLFASLTIWGVCYLVIGLAYHAATAGAAVFMLMAGSMLWNVITVSWRQRRIPQVMMGRVNSIYRFFGWGSMPLGALAGGALVSMVELEAGRETALRAPFLLAAAGSAVLLLYALFRLRLE